MANDDGRSHGMRNFLIALFLIPCLFIAALLSITFLGDANQPPVCDTTSTAVSVDPKSVPNGPIAGYGHAQLVNAAQIMLAAKSLGLTVRDQEIGVMTAMDESSLTVLDHGDSVGPDSRGLFQQRDNGAWGSLSDRLDPFISATNFFKVEMKVAGRETMEPTLVAHAVQANADPYAYARYWGDAQTVVQALGGIQPASTETSRSTDGDGAAQTTPGSPHYATAGMKPQTVAVANTLGAMFHLKTIGGYRPMSSPYDDPVYGHASGLAIDFMINDIPNGVQVGYDLANYAKDHAAQLGVQYIIYHQHIWAPYRADEGWRLMADRGDPTQNHMDHVHVSLNGKGSTNLPAGGGVPAGGCSTANDPNSPAGPGTAVTQTGWAKPENGPITSPFGMRTNPVTGVYNLHSGVDIGAACYAPIYAANKGTVIQAGPATGYGNLITVDHGSGVVTRYAHMFNDGVLVHVGDQVTAGQQIAKVGTVGNSTGCHLHFEVKQNGSFVDPLVFMQKVGVKFG